VIWTLFLLMQHPAVAQALCDEIDGSGIDPVSEGQRLRDLPLLDQVWQESLRLFTPVPYQIRRVTAPGEVAGMPAGRDDLVVIGCLGNNRLADVFEEAARLRPERWANHRFGGFDCLTFSAGPRRCVGSSLAEIMVKVTLAAILRSRRPQLVPGTRIDLRVAVTLRPRAPIPVVMARRDRAFQAVPVAGTIRRLYA